MRTVRHAEGFEAAIGQHDLWGFTLAMRATHGCGAPSTSPPAAAWSPTTR
jgi:hypothetical protein